MSTSNTCDSAVVVGKVKKPKKKSSNNQNDENDNVTIAPLDERVMVQEFILAHLIKRQALLAKQRQGMERNVQGLEADLDQLASKERSLLLAQRQQMQLQSEVQSVMLKNKDKIRLVTQDEIIIDVDVADIADVVAVVDAVQLTEDHHQMQQAIEDGIVKDNNSEKEVIDLEAQESGGTIDKDDNEMMVEAGTERSDSQDEDETSIPADKEEVDASLAVPICENPFTAGKAGITALFAGINVQKHTSSTLHSTRLHLLVNGKRLEQIMNLIVSDQTAMDELYPDGRHRRESLFHTCCCLMRPTWEKQHQDTPKSAAATAMPITSGDDTAEKNGNSDEPAWSMDPNTSLCPYELGGECADPYCPFQHLKTRSVESQTLILELLPLPTLNLVPSLLLNSTMTKPTRIVQNTNPTKIISSTTMEPKVLEDEKKESNRKEEEGGSKNEATEPSSKRQKVIDETIATTDETMAENKKDEVELTTIEGVTEEAVVPLDFNDDFLSLPVADNGEDGSDSDDEDAENDDEADRQITMLWWMTGDDHDRLKGSQKQHFPTSVEQWLETVFELYLQTNSNTLVYRPRATTPSQQEQVRHIGRLVDALQLVLHAGCYDYASAICDMIAVLCNDDIRWEGLQHLFATAFPMQWKVANRLQQRNLYAVALVQQVLLSSISEVLRFTLQGHDKDSTKETILAELLSRIVKILDVSEKPDKVRTFLRRLKSEFPDLLPLGEAVVEMQKWYSTEQLLEQDDSEGVNYMDQLDQLQKMAQNCSGRMATFAAIVKIGAFATAAVETIVYKRGASQKSAARLESKLDNICSWIDEPFNQPHLRMMLAPVLAVRVSLLVALRRYDRAQRALERYLIDNPNNDKVGIMSFSDLLWSQLVTLRATLPCRQDSRNEQVGSTTGQLSQIVTQLGLKLNYMSLVGDRNLFQPFLNCLPCHSTKQAIKKWRGNLKATISFFLSRAIKVPDHNASAPDMKVDLDSMPLLITKYPGKMLSLERLAFPRTMMLGGSSLKRLSLAGCRMQELPPTFGDYFPNLQELTMSNNNLTVLPPSFRKLTALMRLDASENKLSALPDNIGECSELEHLILSKNRLSNLPEDIGKCSKLQHIDLTDNRFEKLPNNVVLYIDALVFLEMKGNPCDSKD